MITSSDDIKEELAGCTRMLAFPRQNGTAGNEQARTIIVDYLKSIGIDSRFEEFVFNPLPARIVSIYLTISLITCNFMIFEITWFSFLDLKWLQVMLGMIMFCLLSLSFSLPVNARWRVTRAGSEKRNRFERTGVNIIAEINHANSQGDDGDQLQAIIGAHHDSIALLFPPKFSLFLYLINSIGVLVIAGLSMLEGAWFLIAGDSSAWLKLAESLLAILATFTLLATFFNKRSNESCGAVDNASGCAMVLLLAKYSMAMPASRFSRLRFVLFDAEEAGLWGSLHHALHGSLALDQHQLRDTIVISLDGVGGPGKFMASESHGFPRVTRSRGNRLLTEFHEQVAREGIKMMTTWYPYAASDHAPFIAAGASATWISRVYVYANSKRDGIENVNASNMLETLELLEKFLEGSAGNE